MQWPIPHCADDRTRHKLEYEHAHVVVHNRQLMHKRAIVANEVDHVVLIGHLAPVTRILRRRGKIRDFNDLRGTNNFSKAKQKYPLEKERRQVEQGNDKVNEPNYSRSTRFRQPALAHNATVARDGYVP